MEYALLSVIFPLLWVVTLWLSGAYDVRYIGTGSDEFRRVLNAGLSLTGGLAIISYAVNNELSRNYLLVSMQVIVAARPVVRYALRKRLHRRRRASACPAWSRSATSPRSQLISELRRSRYHGLDGGRRLPGDETTSERWRACRWSETSTTRPSVVRHSAGTVAVLSLPRDRRRQARAARLGTGEDGHRPVRRPRAAGRGGTADHDSADRGLTLLHVDHPQLSGPRQVVKDLFDRCCGRVRRWSCWPR